jgi:hypothetical protein
MAALTSSMRGAEWDGKDLPTQAPCHHSTHPSNRPASIAHSLQLVLSPRIAGRGELLARLSHREDNATSHLQQDSQSRYTADR